MNRIGLTFLILFSYSCVPRTLIVDHPNLVSLYFEKKISRLENQKATEIALRENKASILLDTHINRSVDTMTTDALVIDRSEGLYA